MNLTRGQRGLESLNFEKYLWSVLHLRPTRVGIRWWGFKKFTVSEVARESFLRVVETEHRVRWARGTRLGRASARGADPPELGPRERRVREGQ